MKIKNSSTDKDYLINQDRVTIYNCGPTVYNDVHIGNIRPVITFDVLVNLLKYLNKKVFYVHNITDIDDKIINKSIQEKRNELELSNYYYEEYLKILRSLNIKSINLMPKVSDNIPGIINFVDDLIKTNHAYVENGDVYFSINSISGYGSVSHQNIDNLLAGVRKEKDDKKHYPLDFVLWKKTKVGINWPTKWNNHGRPGWHTECVYLINKYIGKQVDIHGGGMDLKFPHHENENAQNIALNNIDLAKCWMHMGHINVNGEKMSKSLGNFVLAKDILKIHNANTIRWFFYQAQYQAPLNFSYEVLTTSKNDLLKIKKSINLGLINYYWNTSKSNIVFYKELPKTFLKALEDNLNLPNAIKEVWLYSKLLSSNIKEKNNNELIKNLSYLVNMLCILGITFDNILNDSKLLKQFSMWKEAINKKDYQMADNIRKNLQIQQII